MYKILIPIMCVCLSCNKKQENFNEKELYGNQSKFNKAFYREVIAQINDPSNKRLAEKHAMKLDSAGVSFEKFMRDELKDEDSCYSLAKLKFPNYENNKGYTKFLNESIDKVVKKYQNKYNLSEKEFNEITTIWAMDKNAKKLVGM